MYINTMQQSRRVPGSEHDRQNNVTNTAVNRTLMQDLVRVVCPVLHMAPLLLLPGLSDNQNSVFQVPGTVCVGGVLAMCGTGPSVLGGLEFSQRQYCCCWFATINNQIQSVTEVVSSYGRKVSHYFSGQLSYTYGIVYTVGQFIFCR